LLHAVSVTAVAGKGADLPKGERRDLLIFADSNGLDDAVNMAMLAMSVFHWDEAELRDLAPLTSDPEALDEPLRSAALNAARRGVAVVVF
jgi:hypothetical protein